jgi:hypothetical protein
LDFPEDIMKKLIILTAALLGAGCAHEEPVELGAYGERQEARLSRALAGREAGPPVDCVERRTLRGNRTYGTRAIVFEGPGMLYVNRPPAGCPALEGGRTLVLSSSGSRICRGDIASVVDPVSRQSFGSCGLGDFTPYRRTRR